MPKLIHDTKLYAALLLSVGRQGRKITQKRPLTPIECGKLIDRLMREENENINDIARRLDLGRPKDQADPYKKRDTTQVQSFLNLLRLSDKSKYFAGWNGEKPPKIPFSTLTYLSKLTAEDQDKIIQSTYINNKKNINKDDAKKIARLRLETEMPISDCIENVLMVKPISETTYMIVCEIHEKLKKFIYTNNKSQEKILKILQRELPGEFYSVDTTHVLITVSMNELAYRTFHEQQFKKRIPFTQFLNNFLEDKLV